MEEKRLEDEMNALMTKAFIIECRSVFSRIAFIHYLDRTPVFQPVLSVAPVCTDEVEMKIEPGEQPYLRQQQSRSITQ
jgi:hypothetical protein